MAGREMEDYSLKHGLTHYIDTKAKCRHLKNWPVKGHCGRCLSEFRDGRYSHSCWHFDPALWTFAPLTFSLVQLSPAPLPFVNKYTAYTYTVQCVRGVGVWGSWPQTDKHLAQSPFTGQFLRRRHFALSSMSLIFQRSQDSKRITRFIWVKLVSVHWLLKPQVPQGYVNPTPHDWTAPGEEWVC